VHINTLYNKKRQIIDSNNCNREHEMFPKDMQNPKNYRIDTKHIKSCPHPVSLFGRNIWKAYMGGSGVNDY